MENSFVQGTPDNLKPIISRESRRTGISTLILSAQLKQESGFRANVGSVAGAQGIAQFIPATARAYGLRVDGQVDERNDPEKAIRAQADYMKDLVRQYGTMERALSAYNSGNPERYKDPNFRTRYGSVGETHNYVKNILGMSGQPEPDKPNIIQKVTQEAKTGTSAVNDILKSLFSPPKAKAYEPLPPQVPQQVNRPSLPPAPSAYTVRPGDTLYGIAQQQLGSGNRWRELKGYSGDLRKLPIGTKITI